ncbi:AMP-binding protein [Microbacteriaceae bacterium K1510]|nr:AMP-binding protein [Microbacteriaceae bacterium K1510]
MTDLSRICPTTTAAVLDRAATIAPDVEAVVASDGRISYAKLQIEVERIASALEAFGVRRGDHVGLCLGNSCRWVAMFLAIGSLGAVTVPVNTRFKEAEMAFALKQSRVRFLFTADTFLKIDFVSMLRAICPGIDSVLPDAGLPNLEKIVVFADKAPKAATAWPDFLALAGAPVEAAAKPDDVLLIQYTSGTTSFPKGVMLTHANMLGNAFFSGGRIGFRIGDRLHSARPFFHVAGSTLSILSALQHVITLVTMDRFEPGEALRLLEEERCTHFSGNDTMALMLLNHPDLRNRRLSLRGAWVAASPAVVRRIIDELDASECVVGYGQSEASPNIAQSAWWEDEEVRVTGRMRPQPGVAVRIRDNDTGRDCPPGVSGEIVVRGWNVMRGYFDRPEETAAVLDPDGWLSTGDRGLLGADGRLQFVGRLKDIIRVGGENVAPSEVENMLLTHPAIRQAQVVGVADERLVEVPAAFVIPDETSALTADDVITWCKTNMAAFKVPRHVWIVLDFQMAGMTESSKVRKKDLAAHAEKLLSATRESRT